MALFNGKLKAAVKKVGSTIKTDAKKVGTGTTKLGAKLVTIAKKGGEDVRYAPLLPFKPAMIKSLDSAGIKHTNAIEDIATKFNSNIVNKHYDPTLEIISNDENFAFSMDEDMYSLAEQGGSAVGNIGQAAGQLSTGNVVGAAGSIIQAIITWFKNIKKKKENGQPLSQQEAATLQAADETAQQMAASGELEEQSGLSGGLGSLAMSAKNFIFSPYGIMIGAAIIAYLVFFRKK